MQSGGAHKSIMICCLGRRRWQQRQSAEQVLLHFAKQKSEKLLGRISLPAPPTPPRPSPPVDTPLDYDNGGLKNVDVFQKL